MTADYTCPKNWQNLFLSCAGDLFAPNLGFYRRAGGSGVSREEACDLTLVELWQSFARKRLVSIGAKRDNVSVFIVA